MAAPTAAAGAAAAVPFVDTSTAVTAKDLQKTVDDTCHVVVDLRFKDQNDITEFMKIIPLHFAECRKEPLLIRINVIQDTKDSLHMLLIEEYKGIAGFLAHKETPHYKNIWPKAKAFVQTAAGQMYQTIA